MKQLNRCIALLLSILILFPNQELMVLAKSLPSEQIQPSEPIPLPLPEPMEEDVYAIYWNPGGQLPAEPATPSNATVSNAVPLRAKTGKDTANGLSPEKSVKTLARAVECAEELMERGGLDSSSITIYAMNPLEVADGELYVLNGGNICIAAWAERPYESDVLFYINGGHLTLMNVLLDAKDPGKEAHEAELIHVRGGVLQLGQNVSINGLVVMDYRSELADMEWKEHNATSSNAGYINAAAAESAFQLDHYILNMDEDSIELIEDRTLGSTFRKPVVELVDGFHGGGSEIYLKIKDDGKTGSHELVNTLYADKVTKEEFFDYFILTESDKWNLQVEIMPLAHLRDTGGENEILSESGSFTEDILTGKVLIASYSLSEAKVIYWNPGGAITVGGETYPMGNDRLYDGSDPRAPLKTWTAAAEEARNVEGIVAAMQSLNLGAANAGEYLTQLPDGEFYLTSKEVSLITALGTWNAAAQPAIIVPENKTLIIENLYLGGRYDNSGNETEDRAILVEEGNLIIEKNVRTEEKGYIQVNAFYDLANHPIQICSTDSDYDGDLRVFFGGISENIAYRYVDVVVPGGDLETSIIHDPNPMEKADLVGQALLGRIKLHASNQSAPSGVPSGIGWILRQDTAEDDGIITAQNIELYSTYYYDSIYIDGVDGDDRNYGATCNYPVKTWARAKAIWQTEMAESRKVRQDAAGMTLEQIEASFPMPEVIYICNTVTVDSATEPEWKLELCYDHARGKEVQTEVVSHIEDIANRGEGTVSVPRHEAPKTLMKVTGSGILSICDIFIHNTVDDTDSVTITAETGGTLNLRGGTTLNGRRPESTGFDQTTVTLGNHVTVTGGSSLVMESNWTGSIEYREQGVVAAGTGAVVEMNHGFIQRNNSYRADYFAAGITTHKAGGGVVLRDGARFTMNGGSITGNQTYQYGAGIYLVDEGTTFLMNKGEISDNGIYVNRASEKHFDALFSHGAGISAGKGTIVKIGDGTGELKDTLISNNHAHLAYGAGIYADGKLVIDHAVISNNAAGGSMYSVSTQTAISLGAGVYVGSNGTLTMKNSLVQGNHGAFVEYGNVYGAGIYLAAGTNSHTITGSIITENETGYEYAVTGFNYARGGGIYLDSGNSLVIADTTISKNRSISGGGIYAIGAAGQDVSLTIKRTVIEGNEGIDYRTGTNGDSGGIFFYGYGTLTLEDGTKIIHNNAMRQAGGLSINGANSTNPKVYMMATTPGAIEISGNKIPDTSSWDSFGFGGGICHFYGSLHALNVLICNNEAATMGGGIYAGGNTQTYGYFRNIEFSDNLAADGGAFAIRGGNYYVQDSSFEKNTAANRGGGIHLASASAFLYLSETDDGIFKIRNNDADFGGGISIEAANTFMMNITGPIQNSANIQGSNFYLSGSSRMSIFNGHFKQPVTSKQAEGVHNIYLDDTSAASYAKYFDFSKVVVDKKDGINPDAVFLNSGNSFLTVLAAPPDENMAYGALPIDLNRDAFHSGSVILKPLGDAAEQFMMEPADDLSAAVEVGLQYPDFKNAQVNLDHYRGGRLPRRNELGGFKDSADITKTNVILAGQGVYLAGYKDDGSGGDDSNGGTSPTDAVATFERAKQVLEMRITAVADYESNRPEEEREGFAPLIYICGQVEINKDQRWELDYEDTLFTEVNKYYEIAELRNNTRVHEPQVRRFASFVLQPMIRVDNAAAFTLGRLIIDGMADAVILSEQGSRSPVIYGYAGTHVTLTGDSMIRNNYYSALDIYGELTLEGEKGEVNKQLYNNQPERTVALYGSAKMLMQGEARIITDKTVERVIGTTNHGIWVGGSNVSISMEGNSAIIQESGSTMLNGSLIYSTNSNTSVDMRGQARLEVGNSANAAIYIFGSAAKVHMSEDAGIIVQENASLRYGIFLGLGSTLTMSDRSSVTYGGNILAATHAVYLQPSNTAVALVTMQDHAAILCSDTATAPGTAYVFYGIFVTNGTSPKIELLDNARITGSPNVKGNTRGIYAISPNIKDITISLNHSASIADMGYGIYLGNVTGSSVAMGGKAVITGCTYGIYLTQRTTTTSTANILMKDESKIHKTTHGIHFYLTNSGPINIRMEDRAAIEQNTMGISESTVGSNVQYCTSRLTIEMFGDSRISGNSDSGIQLVHSMGMWTESTGYQRITLHDNAAIGGGQYYNSTDAASGNQGAGIYANGPIQVTMNGTAKISGNGTNTNNGSTANAGIYLTRATNSDFHRAGTARIILNDDASICDNRGGGIYAATIGTPATNYHNEVIIELNGIKEDGSFSAPSIQRNTDAIYLGSDAVLRLKGEAAVRIHDTPYASPSYVARVINNYGDIELDGRSTVDGLIYMNNSDNPITMTYAVPVPAPKYDLHLAEGFVGNIVVRPDMLGIMDLTGANSQRICFNKVSADGMAAERPIVELSPNLVLLGENHVYLSGSGNDNYTGSTPSTAVRTFKRAKELLLGDGYYTTGANIIICTSTVYVSAGDEDWSFERGGFVTNSRSGHRWQPLVIRGEGYEGILITLQGGSFNAISIAFQHITIDGGSEKGIVLKTSVNNQLLSIRPGNSAILGEGAVLQNNKEITTTYSNYSTLGVMILGGTLEIDGGVIRNMVKETSGVFNNVRFASAVMVQGSSIGLPGRLSMKSGQIINNELNAPGAQGTNAHIGTICVYSVPGSLCVMEMQGGVIEHNKVISSSTDPGAAGAIVNYNGDLTISGGMIRENEGGCGSAIFHQGTDSSSRMVFSGGQIIGNRTNVPGQQSINRCSPVYVSHRGFELYGGGADIRDRIYLHQPLSAIKVSDHIVQSGRSYQVSLNLESGYFKKGSVVVEPDGNRVTNVNSYLSCFDIRTNPYVLDQGRTGNLAGNVADVKEEQCLILMKAVYLDSVNGSDSNTGLKPGQAVKSFTMAKTVGASTAHGASDHYVIYVCNKVANTSSETVWTLPEAAYMCRYTGFAVYESDGTETPEFRRAYYGYLIQPDYNLTFNSITVQGRRSADSTVSNGDSLVYILPEIRVTVENGAVFSYNYNNGSYIAGDGHVYSLDSNGGAFQIAEGGTLTIRGGEIKGNSAMHGSAIYLHASTSNPLSFGQLYLTGSPVISGSVYLNGTADITSAYVQPDASYMPSSPLQITVSNDYHGRPLIRYNDGTVPGEAERNHFLFDNAINALYDIVNNGSNASVLELSQRRVIYLDGQNGSDGAFGYDGTTPEKAFKTLKRTFEAIGNHADTDGVLIYVVDTLEINGGSGEISDVKLMNIKIAHGDGTSHYEGYYEDLSGIVNIRGQVYFKRYSQPKGYDSTDPIYDGYGKETLLNSLFDIDNGGKLTLSGIYLDGHSIGSNSMHPTLEAPDVAAGSPLITVKGSSVLQCNRADSVPNGIPTETLFTNNTNERNKNASEYIVGYLNGTAVMEGSSAGIELLAGGTCILEYTKFTNLALGSQVIAGGTDVYSDGHLSFSRATKFDGSVFLEGLGTKEENQNSSRYLTVDLYGTPLINNFQVLLRDPYMGRDMVHYDDEIHATAMDASFFLLEEQVKDFFYLTNRSGYPNILELQIPVNVYIDGIEGIDNQDHQLPGSTPKFPVKSLARAFEILKERGGNTIYVVGTIQVSGDVRVTGNSYIGAGSSIVLGNTNKINIVRYLQPDFARQDQAKGAAAGYDVDDFAGVLLNVTDGATARFHANVSFDGHSEQKTSTNLPPGSVVSRNGEAKAPLITVEKGATLSLLPGAALYHNNNVFVQEQDLYGQHGGAISNSGTTTVDGALFENNKAAKGSVVYQDGIFTIVSAPEKLDGHQNTFYLTSVNTGSELNPAWGTDRVIQIAVKVPEHQIFEVDMDHPVKGREVVRFTSNEAYYPNADAEHEHFRLGSMVPEELFLVEAEYNPDALELQDWEILKVEIPTDIYLVVCRRGSYDSTNKLMGIIDDTSAESDLFTAPNYVIKNQGIYDTKVSITEFEQKTVEANITMDLTYLMNLTADAAAATAENDLYLAVKGLDDVTGGTGFDIAETSLQPYAESPVTAAPIVLGTLKTQTSGNFTFVGAAGDGFVDKYMDASFPVECPDRSEVQKYMDGTSDSGVIHARAKYLLKYKVELVPPRRIP